MKVKFLKLAANPSLRDLYPRVKSPTTKLLCFATSTVFIGSAMNSNAQASGDYRSNATTGNFAAAGNWQKFDGSSWLTATTAPVTADGAISVLSGNTISVAAAASVDQFTIKSGGQVTVNASQTLSLANGTGTDLTVEGTLLNSGSALGIGSGATWTVASGGTYIHNTSSGIATPLNAVTLASGSNFVYRGSSSLQTAVAVSNRTYSNLAFESTSGTWSLSAFSGANPWTTNNLTVGSGVSVNFGTYSGTTTYNGDITINGTFGVTNGARSFGVASSKVLQVAGTLNMGTSQTLSVNSGGTFAGTGTVTGTVAVKSNGIMSPGSSATGTVGTLVTGVTTLEAGSIFSWDLASTPGTTTRGTDYDAVNATSYATTGAGSIFRVVLNGSQDFGSAFWNTSRSWTDVFKNATGTTNTDVSAIFTSFQYYNVSGEVASVPINQGFMSFTGSTLNWTPVPEPSSALAGLLLGAGSLRRRRSA